MNTTGKHPTNPSGEWFVVSGKSNVAQYRYDPSTKFFDVQFHGTPTVYRYKNVPSQVFEAFRAAESKGSFIHSDVKKQYPDPEKFSSPTVMP